MDSTTVYNLFQKHPDLTQNGYFYRPWNSVEKKSDEPYVDTEEELRSEHVFKSYEYCHVLFDLLEEHQVILKHPNKKYGFSYGWKHIFEDWTRGDSKNRIHHHISNGLFIAVCRERGIEEMQDYRGGPNAWVALGAKARDVMDQAIRDRFSNFQQ